jgi:carbonic anhydrase
MDAESAINKLLEGNKRYMSGKLAEKDVGSAREANKDGQHPFATVIACSDSRVVPEFIFDVNVGDIFVIMNAGHCVDTLALGSIEYGIAHLQTPLLIILGHEKCGAVTAACQGGPCPPNIAAILEKIRPAVEKGGVDKIEESIIFNMNVASEEIRRRSEIVRDLEKEGKLKIIEMKYYIEDGRVEIKK